MESKKKGEELQSRREFFKKAAKAALPVVAAVALASIPAVSKAATAMGCTIDACTATCMGSCKGTCEACSHGCATGCATGCTSCSHANKY